MKSNAIKNWPESERPRERLLAEGADKLTEAELLAIILRVGQGTFKKGILGQNASDFARTLLKEFKGLRGNAGITTASAPRWKLAWGTFIISGRRTSATY
jgi:DNA repair protein RadC